MRAAGFVNAQETNVKEENEDLKEGEMSRILAERIMYYKISYPNNKFITEEEVSIICNKYNLVCGKIDRYKGFVPDANLKMVEKFKIKNEDKDKDAWSVGRGYSIMHAVYKDNTNEEYDDDGKLGRDRDTNHQYKVVYREAKLRICAPLNDMDMSDMTLKDNYKMIENIKPVKDPIVLQPVIDGYLIVTAWGDEASDEIVVNQSYN